MPRALKLRNKKQNNRKRMLRCVTNVTSEGKHDNVTMYSSNESFTHFKVRAICSFAHSPTLTRRAVTSAIAAVICAYNLYIWSSPYQKYRSPKEQYQEIEVAKKFALFFLSIDLGKSHLVRVSVNKRKNCRIQLKNCKTLLLLSCGRT